MDWLKELLEAHNQRIKTPIIGSIILAFIAWNWQAIFYVLFASNSVRMRLEYWDEEVLHWHDYWVPAVIGLVLALSMPLISLLGAYASAWPTNELRRFTNKQAHGVEFEKKKGDHLLALTEIGYEQKLATHKEELEEQRERFIASKLRQQESLLKINDKQVREEISEEANNEVDSKEIELTHIDMDSADINNFIPDIDAFFGEFTPKAIKNRWIHEHIGSVASSNPIGSPNFYKGLPKFVKQNLPDTGILINRNLVTAVNGIDELITEVAEAESNKEGLYQGRLELALQERASTLQKFYMRLQLPEYDKQAEPE